MNKVHWHSGIEMSEVEKRTIIEAYLYYKGNSTQTALGLKVSTKTMYNKLKVYKISYDDIKHIRFSDSMPDTEVYWLPGMGLDDVKKLAIKKAYRFYGRNTRKTAKGLNLSVKTIYNKLKSYGDGYGEDFDYSSEGGQVGLGQDREEDKEVVVPRDLSATIKGAGDKKPTGKHRKRRTTRSNKKGENNLPPREVQGKVELKDSKGASENGGEVLPKNQRLPYTKSQLTA